MKAVNVAVVPMKALDQAKSRLAGCLSPAERRALCLAMLRRVLAALLATPALDAVWVASRDPEVLATAAATGARPFREQAADLNGALAEAAATLAPGDGFLAVPGDLPLIRPRDVAALLAAAPDPGGAIVRTRDGGTGALFLRPPGAIPLLFGPNSFQAHLAAASLAGFPLRPCHLPRLSRDIDRPEDLRLVQPGRFPGALRRLPGPARLRRCAEE